MKKLITLTTLSWIGLLCWAQAQPKLAELVAEVNGEWMLGEWVAYTESGEEMTQKVSWDLDEHVVVMHFQAPMLEVKAMTGLDPASGQVKYVGFSNRGGALTGTWGEADGWPLLRLRGANADGQVWKMALLYKRVDDKTMRVEIHGMDGADNVIQPARTTTQFKRKDKKPQN